MRINYELLGKIVEAKKYFTPKEKKKYLSVSRTVYPTVKNVFIMEYSK